MRQTAGSEPAAAAAGPSVAEMDWPALRERILAALDEDPVNEAALIRALDRREPTDLGPAERILTALTGTLSAPAEAVRFLDEALSRQAEHTAQTGHGEPLRVSLLAVLLASNRRRTQPMLTEMRSAAAPSIETVADAGQAATAPTALLGAVQGELRRARRFSQPAALAYVRLDRFDDLVWAVGPALADRSLRAAALLVKNELRDVDWVARTAGAELVAFLAGTGRFGALLAAKRIASKLADLTLPLPGGGAPASVSIGIAACPEDASFATELFEQAQAALLRARADGGGIISEAPHRPSRALLRVPAERVRIVIRRLSERPDPDQAPPDEGLLFASAVAYDVGADLELDCIEVEGTGRARLRGRVVRLEEVGDGRYEIGVACRLDGAETTLLHGEASG
ncbi:MAG: GGDEF domain-containing protein [Acidobacteriota bacterium]